MVIEVQAGDESKEIVVRVGDVVAFAAESRPKSGPRSQEPVTLLHALTYTLQQNDQLFLHAGFGNAAVLEKTDNDDAVVRLIATFYKRQGEVPMKHSAVRRSSMLALVQTCSVYTCRLELANEEDPKLKYMLRSLTAEYDPTDRHSPKRKERDEGNGADTLNASIYNLTDMILCCSPAPSRSPTCGLVTSSYGSGSESSSYCLNSLTRILAQGEPLFAQLGTVNEHHLRLKCILLVIHDKAGGYRHGVLITHIRAGSECWFAEMGPKGEHLFAETVIKGEHLFA